MAILNLAAYQFTAIADTQAIRRDLLAQASALDIKGTILVTPEGPMNIIEPAWMKAKI